MRCSTFATIRGLLLAVLTLLVVVEGASAQRVRGRNPYYYSYPLTPDYYYYPNTYYPFGANVYTYPATDFRSYYPPTTAALPAIIDLSVPANAQVWFNDVATAQTGTQRRFMTPPLNPDNNYHYQVRARWTEDGQPVEKTRYVNVIAGQVRMVSFSNAPAR
jgi:uncharacterized protein (TIGR03000 family)